MTLRPSLYARPRNRPRRAMRQWCRYSQRKTTTWAGRRSADAEVGDTASSGRSVCPELTRAATLRLLEGWPWEAPMGALVFWLGVGILLGLLAARPADRRDRRRGHSLRHSGEMSQDAWEHRRDAVAGDSSGHLN